MCFCLSKGKLCVSVSTHIHVYNHLQCGLKRFDLKGKIRQFFFFFFNGYKCGGENEMQGTCIEARLSIACFINSALEACKYYAKSIKEN